MQTRRFLPFFITVLYVRQALPFLAAFLCTLLLGAPASAFTITGAAMSDTAAIAHIARAMKPTGGVAIVLLQTRERRTNGAERMQVMSLLDPDPRRGP